jgi:hypothetical protein
MKRTQTIALALLVAALPLTSAAFASDRGHDDRGHGGSGHTRGHDNGHGHGHGQHEYRGHHNHHHYRYDHNGRHYDTVHYGQRAQVVLPFPPLPPFPVIVLNKKQHGAHVELRRPY